MIQRYREKYIIMHNFESQIRTDNTLTISLFKKDDLRAEMLLLLL